MGRFMHLWERTAYLRGNRPCVLPGGTPLHSQGIPVWDHRTGCRLRWTPPPSPLGPCRLQVTQKVNTWEVRGLVQLCETTHAVSVLPEVSSLLPFHSPSPFPICPLASTSGPITNLPRQPYARTEVVGCRFGAMVIGTDLSRKCINHPTRWRQSSIFSAVVRSGPVAPRFARAQLCRKNSQVDRARQEVSVAGLKLGVQEMSVDRRRLQWHCLGAHGPTTLPGPSVGIPNMAPVSPLCGS